MNSDHLSQRLMSVVQLIQTYSQPPIRLADIGSDHAYLPCFMAKQNLVAKALAGEVVKGPFESAQEEIAKQGLSPTVEARLGDGLAIIADTDQINAISICGMGGSLIVKILEEGQAKLKANTNLYLQPNIGEMALRTWLMQHQYQIIEEQLVKEGQRFYEIIVAIPSSKPVSYNLAQLLMGPYHLEHKTPLFDEKFKRELANYQAIVKQIQDQASKADEKLAQIQSYMKLISQEIGE